MQEDGVTVLCPLVLGGWAHLPPPLPYASPPFAILSSILYIFLRTVSKGFPKFSLQFYWIVECEGGVTDALFLAI